MEPAYQTQQELVTSATPSVTRAACLESERMRTRAPRGMKKLAHLKASAKTMSSAVLLLQDVAPKTPVAGDHTKLGHKRSEPPSVKSLQSGDSMPVILVVVRQVGNMVNFFFGLGNRKASGLSLSTSSGRCAHTGHRAVIILILPYISSLKLRPGPRLVLRRLYALTKASSKPATRMQSLSLSDGNFEQ